MSALKRHLPWLGFVAKLAITAGLLAYLLAKVDIGPVLRQIGAMSPLSALGAELVLGVQLVLLGVRWQLVNRVVGAPLRFGQAMRLSLIGHFSNQVLPSGLAGDAVRAWLVSREGMHLGRAVRGIVSDRIVGLLVLVLIVAATVLAWPALASRRLPDDDAFRAVSIAGLASLVALYLLGARVARLLARFRLTHGLAKVTGDLHGVLHAGAVSVAIVALAAIVHVLNVVAIALCAQGMRIDLDFGAALTIVPAVMLVSLAPVSFAGWGVREGAMAVGLGLLGVATRDALAVSVAFGVLQIVLGVPGAVLWLAGRRAAAGEA